MCGICGYIHFDSAKRPSESILKSMMDTIAYRGPDDSGAFVKDNVALGHRRLSIIDLKTGHQPMLNSDGSVVIVYNGEVYNFLELKTVLLGRGHLFKTNSDTEVVLHAYEEYGEDCVKHFNGMFALAIWDSKKKTLFLARDRFGKKPLYYASFDNQFIFGSELKAVLKHPSVTKEIDLNSLSKYLAYEYVPSPYSIFKKINKLEAGSRLSVSVNAASVNKSRYWDLSFNTQNKFDHREAAPKLIELFRESVRRRLISDVPLGVFLSGGIDSSAVVCMMAELMSPKDIKTFSIGFKEKSFDESPDARRVAEHFGTDHHEEILSPKSMLDVLPDVLNVLDEPFADSSIIPTYLVSKFTRRHVKVALGGDGGDELFLGYPSFIAHKLDSCFGFIPSHLKKRAVNLLLRCVKPSNDYMSSYFKAKRFARGLGFPEETRHQAWIGSFTPEEQESLLIAGRSLSLGSELYGPTKECYAASRGLSPLDRAIYIYVKTYMTDDILTKVDRASMANSLEVRAPFLDTEFAEYATGIPASYKIRNFTTKWILKEALKGRLPEQIISKPKQGFAVPVAKWLKEDLAGLLRDAFNKTKIEREGIFNYAYIDGLIKDFLANREDTRKEIWALFMFEMWYDKWAK